MTTGFIAGAMYLAILFVGSVPFVLLATIIAVITLLELAAMKHISLRSPGVLLSAAFTAALVFAAPFLKGSEFQTYFIRLLVLLVLVLLAAVVFSKNRFQIEEASFLFFFVSYIGFSFYLLAQLRLESLLLVLFVQITMWATDSGAYFVGRKLGRHKLAPHISPNKTVEGSIGAVAAAFLVAAVFQFIIRRPLFASAGLFVTVTLIISVLGQVGDLAESAVKRHFGVKDSGDILPGHGGFFDRFDSLIFVLPVLYLAGMIS
ncbi:phosphatidate cytidylyltransferase [Sporolactobacillus vineae]|uniref:phosphatidate cytidylyltransferase n=1 Tax=Sporolactobacillus vineae TaxID=444463 RepID=UPI000310AC36|nr:phosphatidate cytidylyltransferase [Sporolactobacillus vineae]